MKSTLKLAQPWLVQPHRTCVSLATMIALLFITACSGLEAPTNTSDPQPTMNATTVGPEDLGELYGWGTNSNGEVGDGGWVQLKEPTRSLAGGELRIATVSAGSGHTLAIDEEGGIWSWGDNSQGQLGDPTVYDRYEPRLIPSLEGVPFKAVAAGTRHSLAVDAAGRVWAWGSNSDQALGLGEPDPTDPTVIRTPVRTVWPDPAPAVVDVAAGQWHSVALDEHGTVWGWGHAGMDGDPSFTSHHTPQPLAISSKVVAIASGAGATHTMALDVDGNVWAWGANNLGQIHPIEGDTQPVPIKLDLGAAGTASAIAVGGRTSFIVDDDGAVWGWGVNTSGQLGIGTVEEVYEVTRADIDPNIRVQSVAAGRLHAMALTVDGDTLAWGWNNQDQLATGVALNEYQLTPAPVELPTDLRATMLEASDTTSHAILAPLAVSEPDPNEAPIADAGGPYTVIAGNSITLDGSGSSDPDDDALTYEWDYDYDGVTFDADASGLMPTLLTSAADTGTLTVAVRVSDPSLEDDIATSTVTVQSHSQAVQGLIEDVAELAANGTLKQGQANGLARPLENVLKSLSKDKAADACNQLQDFIDEVDAKEADGALPGGDADDLRQAALPISSAVGCS